MRCRQPGKSPFANDLFAWVVFAGIAALAGTVGFNGPTVARADEPTRFAADRPFDVQHLQLDLYLELQEKFVRSRATISGTATRPLDHITLDAVKFEDVRVMVRNETHPAADCEFENDGEHIIIKPPAPLAAGEKIDIFIDYTLKEPESGLHFFAPSDEEPEAPLLVWSQGEATENRYWIPCVDNPNEMQTTEVRCTVENPLEAISNGRLLGVKENKDGTRTFHWTQEQPHVSYLITLIVGEFAKKTVKWRDIDVTYRVQKKHESKIDNTFSHTPDMMEYFSEKIGVPYAWVKYDQTCCYGFGGGMENTSATTLGERTLHDDRAHLDDDSDGLVSHELAHQWFGDLLTCRDWAHLWLNEGFASYFEALWDEHHNGPDEFAHNLRGKARAAISGGREHPIVWKGYPDPGVQFDDRAYPKGAWVLHMIRRRLGDDLFWKVMKSYVENHIHKSVETVDLRKSIEEVTGRSFERFFYDWTERAGSPNVTVTFKWLADDHLAQITVEQTQKEAPFHFPLDLEFGFADGETPLRITHEVTEKRCLFHVPMKNSPRRFRVDPNQAVLMTLTRQQPRNLWMEQLTDPDPIARFDAVDYFAKAGGTADIERLAARLGEESFWAVRSAIAAKLGDNGGEAARKALLTQIGTEHPKVRREIVDALGHFTGNAEVEQALAQLIEKGDPSYRVEAAAIHSYASVHAGDDSEVLAQALERDSDREIIRNAAISAMGDEGEADSAEKIKAWMTPDRPMECRAAAIRALGKLVARDKLKDEAKVEALDLIGKAIEGVPLDTKKAALFICGEMGARAKRLIPKIEPLAKTGTRRIKRIAADALAKIREQQKPDEQIKDLRESLAKLIEENKRISEKLDKLEAMESGEAPHEAEHGHDAKATSP